MKRELRIIMNSGEAYNADIDLDDFIEKIHDNSGQVINQIIIMGSDKKY